MSQAWGAGRKTLVWINLVVQVAVLAGLLVMVNLIVRKHNRRIDVTAQRLYELSNITEDFLKNIDFDLQIWMTVPQMEMSPDPSMHTAWQRTNELLEEFRKRNDRIKVEILGEGNPRVQEQVKHFQETRPNTIYLLATLGPERVNKRAVSLYELYQGNPSTGEVTGYRGEPHLVQTIREMSSNTKRVVYELQDHQEIPTEERSLGRFTHFLTTAEGVEFRKLRIGTQKRIPPDADALVILAPGQPFASNEIDILRNYLEEGGRLFVALRAKTSTGLEDLLQEYAVRVGKNIVLDPTEYAQMWGPMAPLARQFPPHEITQGMVEARLVFPETSTVDPEKKDKDWKIQPIVLSGPRSWEEKGALGPEARPKPDSDERVGNLPLVLAVEKPASNARDENHKRTKLVVWGGWGALTHGALADSRQVEFILNNFRWLFNKPVIDIKPKTYTLKPLEMSPDAFAQMKWVTLAGFPLLGIVLGWVAWFVRRK